MAREPERRAGAATAAIALAFPFVVAVSTVILELAGSDELDGVAIATYLLPVLAFGTVVARAWVLVLPLLWGAGPARGTAHRGLHHR